jgi:dTDP-4-dehydrorhamnose reductase
MIWLIGNKGMLGTELSLLLEKYGLTFVGTDYEVDITNLAVLRDFTRSQQNKNQSIDWIINCAAFTAVDNAEDEKEKSRLINTEGPQNIAYAANETGARLIHISTDYVFNGQGRKPYTEDDAADPIGVYGLTKRDGEIKVLEENKNTYIIRTAWLYGKYGNNFVHTMLKIMKEQETIRVVNDQKGSPTWTHDLSEVIVELIRTADKKTVPYGIYHFTGEAEITWFDFAQGIYTQARALGILTKDCEINPCISADFPAKVKRPSYSVLDKTKIKTALNITIPLWDKSLYNYLAMEEVCVN